MLFSMFQSKKNSAANERKHTGKKEELFISVASNVGKICSDNEDNFYVDEIGCRRERNCSAKVVLDSSKRHIFAVCDGMGGEAFGEEASRIAVMVLSEFREQMYTSKISQLSNEVNRYSNEANRQICQMVKEKRCKRSGSTLAMVCIDHDRAYAYNLGDSRVYYWQNGKLKQITEDQTLAVKKMKANIYTEEEAKNSPDSHKITSFLGVDNREIGLTALSYPSFKVGNGKILICSDGLTDMCSDKEIADILSLESRDVSNLLVEKAIINGGIDNITCIVIQSGD